MKGVFTKSMCNIYLYIKFVYICNICGKFYQHRSSLHRHILTHRKTSFLCDQCQQEFTRSDSLKNHKLQAHGIDYHTNRGRPKTSKRVRHHRRPSETSIQDTIHVRSQPVTLRSTVSPNPLTPNSHEDHELPDTNRTPETATQDTHLAGRSSVTPPSDSTTRPPLEQPTRSPTLLAPDNLLDFGFLDNILAEAAATFNQDSLYFNTVKETHATSLTTPSLPPPSPMDITQPTPTFFPEPTANTAVTLKSQLREFILSPSFRPISPLPTSPYVHQCHNTTLASINYPFGDSTIDDLHTDAWIALRDYEIAPPTLFGSASHSSPYINQHDGLAHLPSVYSWRSHSPPAGCTRGSANTSHVIRLTLAVARHIAKHNLQRPAWTDNTKLSESKLEFKK